MPGNPTGSLRVAMDALCALEAQINDRIPDPVRKLAMYRWRPQEMPDLPALWNWMPEAPEDKLSNAHLRDKLDLRIQVGIEHTNVDEQMAAVEDYFDIVGQVVGQALQQPAPLDETVNSADIKGARTVLDRFNQIDLLCIEFRLELQLIKPLY